MKQTSLFNRVWNVLSYLFIYFLSLVLIAFAFSKFYNNQFQVYNYSGYIPLKDVSRMTHAWSFFGRSYPYNLFLGIVEFAAGASLLFNRTRLIGLLLALGLFTNILIIDIEFQVQDALLHVIVETIMVVLLLIPYLPSLKQFFWDMAGKVNTVFTQPKSKWGRIIPTVFLLILCVVFIVEAYYYDQSKDGFNGEYSVQKIILGKDTLSLSSGKYTNQPMLFFEFGNVCILSANDSAFWGDYRIQQDSVELILDKPFKDVKSIKASLDKAQKRIQGVTNQQLPIEIQLGTMPPLKK